MRGALAFVSRVRVTARAHWRRNGDNRLELDFGPCGELQIRRDQVPSVRAALDEFERRQMFEDNHDRLNDRTEGLGEF